MIHGPRMTLALRSLLSDQVSAFISGFSRPGPSVTTAGSIHPNKWPGAVPDSLWFCVRGAPPAGRREGRKEPFVEVDLSLPFLPVAVGGASCGLRIRVSPGCPRASLPSRPSVSSEISVALAYGFLSPTGSLLKKV